MSNAVSLQPQLQPANTYFSTSGEERRHVDSRSPAEWAGRFSFQNGQIRQLTCILLMSYCSVSGGTGEGGGGGGGLFAPLMHDQSMQFLTVVQPHRLRLLLQPLIPVQLAQVGQVGLWKRSAQTYDRSVRVNEFAYCLGFGWNANPAVHKSRNERPVMSI